MFFKYGATSSLLSMPFGSSQKMMTTTNDDDNATMNVNIEDQDANFTFRLYSFSKCRYAEFYLADKGKRIKKSSVTTTLSKEKKTEKEFLLSTHHMFYPIPVNE